MTSSREKIRDWTAAARWRAGCDGVVVFTNGVFDLVHPGHVALLEAARREGNFLVVGVNSDASARRLGKGDGRPVIPALSRARVVAAFAAVDCVVLFDQETPLALIRALEPDVLVKGGDYDRETTVGAEVVEARGGRVTHIPLESGFSTTAIVEQLRAPS